MSVDYWAATQDAISFTTSIKKYGLVCLIGVIFVGCLGLSRVGLVS